MKDSSTGSKDQSNVVKCSPFSHQLDSECSLSNVVNQFSESVSLKLNENDNENIQSYHYNSVHSSNRLVNESSKAGLVYRKLISRSDFCIILI